MSGRHRQDKHPHAHVAWLQAALKPNADPQRWYAPHMNVYECDKCTGHLHR